MKGYMKPPTVRERAKYRAAKEAGLLERVLEVGWAGLTAKESGRIGGMLAHRQNNDIEMWMTLITMRGADITST